MEVIALCNHGSEFHYPRCILWATITSHTLPTPEGVGAHRGMNTWGVGIMGPPLESVRPSNPGVRK